MQYIEGSRIFLKLHPPFCFASSLNEESSGKKFQPSSLSYALP